MEAVRNTKVKIIPDEELEIRIKRDSIIQIEAASLYNISVNGARK